MLPPFECCLVNLILHESFIMGYLFTHSEWRTSFYNVSYISGLLFKYIGKDFYAFINFIIGDNKGRQKPQALFCG